MILLILKTLVACDERVETFGSSLQKRAILQARPTFSLNRRNLMAGEPGTQMKGNRLIE